MVSAVDGWSAATDRFFTLHTRFYVTHRYIRIYPHQLSNLIDENNQINRG